MAVSDLRVTGGDGSPIMGEEVLSDQKTGEGHSTPGTAILGCIEAYTMTVTNNGPSPITCFNLTNVLPAALHNVSFGIPSEGSYDSVQGVWSGVSLAYGQSVTLTVAVAPEEEGLSGKPAALVSTAASAITSPADAPILSNVPTTAVLNGDGRIDLSKIVVTPAESGQDIIHITISGVPLDVVLNIGAADGEGNWTIKNSEFNQLDNLSIAPLNGQIKESNFNLSVTATTGNQSSTATSSAQIIAVMVMPAADRYPS